MKLLFCRACDDVVKLLGDWRYCFCGLSSGTYTDNGNDAWYRGDYAEIIGIDNNDLAHRNQRGEWWLMHEKNGDRVKKVPE